MIFNRNKERLIEQHGEDHPAFGSYLECMTRANFTAVATFCTSFSFTYIAQNLLKNKLPYSTKYFILLSTVSSSVFAYKVSKARSEVCQVAWMAAEDKVTYFTQKDKVSSPD